MKKIGPELSEILECNIRLHFQRELFNLNSEVNNCFQKAGDLFARLIFMPVSFCLSPGNDYNKLYCNTCTVSEGIEYLTRQMGGVVQSLGKCRGQ